ncbi:hypothetical protein Q9L58_002662 [Maublancomyces gigas]|uniref:F-box domain-containing protein n=1 Tax=Discina gigas TaxID=1032678 RepID=A0ABR3GQZ3_9PEZI
MSLLIFPNELLLQVASYLDRPAIYSLLLTSRRLFSLLNPLHLAFACDSTRLFTTAVFISATSSPSNLSFLLNLHPFSTSPDTSSLRNSDECDITIHTLSRPPTLLFHRHPREFASAIAIPSIIAAAPAIVVASRKFGHTPLHFAASAGDTQSVLMLLRHGHNIDIKNHDKDSALLSALQNEHDHTARILVEDGANIHASARNGHMTFHLTAAWGRHEIVKLMLAKGARLESRDRDGHTVLHDAAQMGEAELVKLLLEKGADINAQVVDTHGQVMDRSWGDTPLHLAARRRHAGVVRLLLDAGADVTIRGRDGTTLSGLLLG